MQIKEIKAYGKELGLTRPYRISYKEVTSVANAFVEIHLQNGIVGYGSANPSKYVVSESAEDCISFLESEDFSFLQGRSIREFEALIREINEKYRMRPGTLAALDIALHDAFTRFLQIPLHAFFGRSHISLPTSITIGLKPVDETLAEAAEYVGRGFRCIKVKTGEDPEKDSERVLKILENHTGISVRVDANQGYRPEEMQSFVRFMGKSVEKLELVEQPYPTASFIENLQTYRFKGIAADESLRNSYDAIKLARRRSVDIFNIKLMKCGGLTEAKRIASIAQQNSVSLMWGCNDESRISIAAALHLAYSYPHTKYIDLDGSFDLAEDLVAGGFDIRGGHLIPLEEPGLGVSRL